MNVLVTGSSGFIGSHLVEHFRAGGHRVLGLDIRPSPWTTTVGSVADGESVRAALTVAPDLVLHAAAQTSVPYSVAHPEEDNEANFEGTRMLAQHTPAGAPWVFFSTVAVYGDALAPDEETEPAPLSPYAKHKAAAEGLIRSAVAERRISRAVILRMANIYGPRQRPPAVVPSMIEKLGQGRPPVVEGSGHQQRDFLFVADLIGLIEKALAQNETLQLYNVGSGKSVTVEALAQTLLSMVEREDGVFDKAPARPADIDISAPKVGLATERLGWRPEVPLHEGLRRTWMSFQEGFGKLTG